MTAESAYHGVFKMYNNLEAKRKQQRFLLKPKYLEAFDNDTKQMLEEKSKVLRWVVDKVPFLRDIEMFRTKIFSHWKDKLRPNKSVKAAAPIFSELTNLENRLKTEISSDSEKQTLCNQVERLVVKLDEIKAKSIQKIKQQYRSQELVGFSKIRSHY